MRMTMADWERRFRDMEESTNRLVGVSWRCIATLETFYAVMEAALKAVDEHRERHPGSKATAADRELWDKIDLIKRLGRTTIVMPKTMEAVK